jgi:hypothetical protein
MLCGRECATSVDELKRDYDSIKELSDKIAVIVNNQFLEGLPKGAGSVPNWV